MANGDTPTTPRSRLNEALERCLNPDTAPPHANRMIVAIRQALVKVEEGTYTICSDCGEEIPPRRLQAYIYATRCVECQNLVA